MRAITLLIALVALLAACSQTAEVPGNESPAGYEDEVWQYRIDRSFEPTECPAPPDLSYPASYYQGPLIDTHFHLPHIPDGVPGSEEGDPQKGGTGGRDDVGPSPDEERRPFYDQLPLLGRNISVDEIACALITDGSAKAFAFFPVFPSIEWQLLEVARRTMERYPHLYVPFIMTPGPDDVPPTMDGYHFEDAYAEPRVVQRLRRDRPLRHPWPISRRFSP